MRVEEVVWGESTSVSVQRRTQQETNARSSTLILSAVSSSSSLSPLLTNLLPSTPSLLSPTSVTSITFPLSPHASSPPFPSFSLSFTHFLTSASVLATGPRRLASSHHDFASLEKSITRRRKERQGGTVSMNWRT